MIRSLKMLGLLTIAALATSAMVASAAQAEVNLTAGQTLNNVHTTTNIHGEQTGPVTENYLETKTAGGQSTQVTCTKGKFYGTVTNGTAKEIGVTPQYEECGVTDPTTHVVANHRVTVTMEGCTYKFTEPTHLETNTFTGKADLVCPAGKQPIVHIFGNAAHTIAVCTIKIEPEPNQGQLSHVVYHNKTNAGAPDDITATVTIENIKYETAGAGCPENGVTKTNANYVSNVTLTSGETETPGGVTKSLNDDLWFSTV
jgi:hypothetical protein